MIPVPGAIGAGGGLGFNPISFGMVYGLQALNSLFEKLGINEWSQADLDKWAKQTNYGATSSYTSTAPQTGQAKPVWAPPTMTSSFSPYSTPSAIPGTQYSNVWIQLAKEGAGAMLEYNPSTGEVRGKGTTYTGPEKTVTPPTDTTTPSPVEKTPQDYGFGDRTQPPVSVDGVDRATGQRVNTAVLIPVLGAAGVIIGYNWPTGTGEPSPRPATTKPPLGTVVNEPPGGTSPENPVYKGGTTIYEPPPVTDPSPAGVGPPIWTSPRVEVPYDPSPIGTKLDPYKPPPVVVPPVSGTTVGTKPNVPSLADLAMALMSLGGGGQGQHLGGGGFPVVGRGPIQTQFPVPGLATFAPPIFGRSK